MPHTPSKYMLPTSRYSKPLADHAVAFIQELKHTKGEWAGKPFILLPWEVHQKAVDIEEERRIDNTFYPVLYAAPEDADWTDPEVWKKCCPSLGVTTLLEDMLVDCENAKQNAADEIKFRQDHLCQWTNSQKRWFPMDKYDKGAEPFDPKDLYGWECYGGLDLASVDDIAAFVLVFPPQRGHDCYFILPYFWIPHENMLRRVKNNNVLYDKWAREGYLETTEGNIIYYDFIEKKLEELADIYNIKVVAFDEWGAVQMAQNLERQAFEMVKTRQSMKALSPPTKELYRMIQDEKLRHGGHPVLRWMFENVYPEMDASGNVKPSKVKSGDKIDGVIATVMALDLAICKDLNRSAYDDHGLLTIGPDGLEEFDHKLRMWKPYVSEKRKREIQKQKPAVAYVGTGVPDYLKKTGERANAEEPSKPAIAYNTGIPDYLKKRGERTEETPQPQPPFKAYTGDD